MRVSMLRGLPLSILVALLSATAGANPVLTVDPGSYALVSSTRVNRNTVENAYSVEVVNSGTTAATAATGTASSSNSTFRIGDASVSFGNVPAGGRVRSQDTFSVRQPTGSTLDPAAISWTTSFQGAPANTAPLANAGPDQVVFQGATVTLNGSGSTDVNGDRLRFSWTLTLRPAGSAATLAGARTVAPTFVADLPGRYEAQLVVSDGKLNSAPDIVVIQTNPLNVAPVANAGPDQTVPYGGTVLLDGTQSSDANGDPLTYTWSFISRPAGSQAVLSDTGAPRPSFAADRVGDFVLSLVVNDGRVNSAPDSVVITTQNATPIADAGPDQTVAIGAVVTLDGGWSTDPNGDALTYSWSLLSVPTGSTAVLAARDGPTPTFVADRNGEYVAQLIVNDGTVNSTPDTVLISTVNSVPVANAGPDQTVRPGTQVVLDGRQSSDPDNDPLSFDWALTTRPAGSNATLNVSNLPVIAFTPDENGLYVVQLIVNDGRSASAPDTASITARENVPTAQDDSATTAEDTSALVDVLANDTDPLEGTLSIELTASPTRGTAVVESGRIRYTPAPDFFGADSFSYRVSNAEATSQPATVGVTVTPVNDPPVAANDAATTDEGQAVAIDVLANDTDVDSASLSVSALTQPANGAVTTNGADVAYVPNAGFSGTDTFSYTVSDGSDTDTASVTVTVTDTTVPVDAVNDAVTTEEDTATTIAVLTNDTGGGGPLSVTAVTQGALGTVTTNGTSVTYTPQANVFGSDSFSYTASDGESSDTATVSVTIAPVNDGPVAVNDAATTDQGVAVTIDVLANDTDLDGPGLLVAAVGGSANATITTDGARVQYQPNAEFSGSDSFSYEVIDGQLSTIGTVTVTVNRTADDTPPQITANVVGTLGGGGWYTSGVEVTWTVTDPESEITSTTGCERVYVIEDTAGRTPTCSATSEGGTRSEPVTIRKDASPPAVRFPTPPPGAGYYLGQVIEADYECTDVGAGVATCEGTTADGASIDTASLGEKTYEVTARDQAGNTQRFTRRYNVVNRGEVIITTVAGGGPIDSQPALEVGLSNPYVSVDGAGNFYIAVQAAHQVVRVDSSGNAVVLVGNGVQGFSGDNGAATLARLASPQAVVADAVGNIYIADYINSRIRKVDAAGTITTVAGNGAYGYSGDGAAATEARLNLPTGVAVDGTGNLYIVDRNNHRIRKVDAGGTIITVAGNGTAGFAGDGGAATGASLNFPSGVAADSAGNLYIADTNNHRIRRVDVGGTITTFAGDGVPGLYGDGGPAVNARLSDPRGIAVSRDGVLHIADSGNSRIRTIDSAGLITTKATVTGGIASVAVDPEGSVYVPDASRRVIRLSSSGATTVIAGNGTFGLSGDRGPATSSSLRFASSSGNTVDPLGRIYVSDSSNAQVRRIDTMTGAITSVPGLGQASDVLADSSGNLLVALQGRVVRVDAISGTVTTVAGTGVNGYGGDDGPAVVAQVSVIDGMTLDAGGNLLLADSGNNRIRRVDAGTGIISTLAGNGVAGFSGDGGSALLAQLASPGAVAVDVDGNILIADTGNYRVRRIDAATGSISTIAGNGSPASYGDNGLAINAGLGQPRDLALDAAGNVYVAGSRLRRIAPTGVISNVGGLGSPADGIGDGGAPLLSRIDAKAVSIDGEGRLVVSDAQGNRVRRIGPAGGYVDATGPSVTPNVIGTAGTADWYSSDVTVTWTVSDPQSPILSLSGCGAQPVTTDTTGVTFTCTATSGGGPTTRSVTIRRDATAPSVSIVSPANDAIYEQGATVLADYACSDATAGVSNCAGPVASGAVIDTATSGAKSFAVTATDAAGNSATVTHNYTVSANEPFVFASPTEGAVYRRGDAVDIRWTGGPPSGTISLALIDSGANTVAVSLGTVPNSGASAWTVPASLPFDGPCGRTYRFYIQDDAGTSWAYSSSFSVLCDTTAPQVQFQTTGPQGTNDWFVGDVNLTWQVEDAESPITSTSGCDAVSVDSDTAGTAFTCTATSEGGTDSRTVTIRRDTVAPSVAIVAPANGAAYEVGATVLANYSCADGTAGVASCTGPVASGAAIDTATSGAKSFTVTATDAAGNPASVTHGYSVNQPIPPVDAVNDATSTDEEQPVTIAVLTNDTGGGAPLSITAVTQGANGVVSIVGVNAFYTPNANFNGTDNFTYTASDGLTSDTATVTVSIAPVNDAPVAVDDSDTTPEETPVTIAVLANDSDIDRNPLTVSAVTNGAHGTVTTNGTSVIYTPVESYSGPDSFTYTASDGALTAIATVTVVVSPVNDAPVAVDDAAETILGQSVDVAVLANDTDAENDTLSIAAVSQPTVGTTTIVGDQIRYAPNADACAIDTFEYAVSDGQTTDTGLVTITVRSTPPTAVASAPARALENDVIQLIGSGSSDPDGDQLTYQWSVVQRPTDATATLSNPTAQNPTVRVSGAGLYTFRLVVQDCGSSSQADVTVEVLPAPTLSIGDAVVAEGNAGAVTAEFIVTLASGGGALPASVAADYTTLSGSATSGDDYQATSGTVSFAAGSATGATQIISVPVVGDTTFEPDETFRVRLSNALLATILDDEGTGTITNDDPDPASVLSLTPSTLSLSTFGSGALTVQLGAPASAGGRVVELTSSDAGVASVPASVTILQGATTAPVPLTSYARDGTVTVTASGAGLVAGSAQVTVNLRSATMALSSGLLAAGRQTTGTVTLAQPAPAGGVAIALSSDNPAVAIVSPASISIAAGQSAAGFTVSAVALGATTLRGSAAGYADATVNVVVTDAVLNLDPIGNVGLGATRALTLALTQAPVADVVVTLTSSDPSIASVTPSVTIPAGQSTPAQTPLVQGLTVGGPVVITASAPGFAPDIEQASVTLSLSLTPTSATIPALRTTVLQLVLSSSAPAGGLVVDISSDDPAIATVTPASLTVPPGQTSAQVTVEGVSAGATTVRASSPQGTAAVSNITVGPAVRVGVCAPGCTFTPALRRVGEDLQIKVEAYLEQAPPDPTTITATSQDGAIVRISSVETVAGLASATIDDVTQGGTSNRVAFWVSGIAQGGGTTLTFSARGYQPVSLPVEIDPSGFVQTQTALNTDSFASSSTLTLYAARLTRTTNVVSEFQEPRAGVVTAVPVTSSDTTVAVIGTSPVTAQVVGNGSDSWSTTTLFDPIGGGTTTIEIGVPAGWNTPVPGTISSITYGRTRSATVTAPRIGFCTATCSFTPATVRVGEDLHVRVQAYLEQAPVDPTTITVTSRDGALVTVSSAEGVPGSASASVANVTLGGSGNRVAFWVAGLTQGTATTLTITAPGFQSLTVPIEVDPSGFVQVQTALSTNSQAANSTLTVYSARLVRSTFAVADLQEPRPGVVANVAVTSSDTAVGTITTSPLTAQTVVNDNDDWSATTQFDPANAGTATLEVGVPVGWDTPTPGTIASVTYGRTRTATVSAPRIGLCRPTCTFTPTTQRLGEDLQVEVEVYLESAPSAPVDVTGSILDAGSAAVSIVETAPGAASAVATGLALGGTGNRVSFWVSGLAQGTSTTLRFSAPGYEPVSLPIEVDPSGFVQLQTALNTNSFAANTTLSMYAARLARTTFAVAELQEPRGGVVTSVPVTSTDTNVGTITSSPLTAQTVGDGGDSWSVTTQFDPVGGGTTTIEVGVPVGWDIPTPGSISSSTYARTRTATVTAPRIAVCTPACTFTPATRRVGEDLQVEVEAYLESAPPSAVEITATIASSASAGVSSAETSPGSGTATVTGVTAGGAGNRVSFWLSGITQGTGTTLTISAPGYQSVTVPVEVDPSGFVQAQTTLSTNTLSSNSTLTVYAARLVRTTNAVSELQEPRAGVVATVPVTSSNTSVGTITSSPLTAQTVGNGSDSWSATTQFDPVGAGTTSIAVGVPAGWDTPTPGAISSITYGTTRTANVTLPRIRVNDSFAPSGVVRIGEDLMVPVRVALELAPAATVAITATSSDGAALLVSDVENQSGSVSDAVTGVATTAERNVWVHGMASGSSGSVTFSAPGYESTTLQFAVDPSGFVTTTADFSISAGAADRAIVVVGARLNAASLLYQDTQEIRGGLVVSVQVTSSDTNVGTISDSPIFVQSIADGAVSEAGRSLFNPNNSLATTSQAVVTVVPPAGWDLPDNGTPDRLVVVTVTP